ncbi:MAG: hypothetical protein Q9M27_01280 [Mariprofundaceae bacterium]|nr:hypothetical protein [Mariprofundaceae bacterium]
MMVTSFAIPASCIAEEPFVAAVGGNFFYMEGHADKTSNDPAQTLNTRVQATTWHGMRAWRIAWDCPRIKAEHYIRMSDGAPLYTMRINHALHRSVEINYSLDAGQPSIYRRKSKNEYVERKIWRAGLRDLGALPQLLMSRQNAPDSETIIFPAINYDDGHVYNLIAKRKGFQNMRVLGRKIRCASYAINLDSWKAAFNKSMHMLVPTKPGSANFLSYYGPDPAGTGEQLTLRLISKVQHLAFLSGPDAVMHPAN